MLSTRTLRRRLATSDHDLVRRLRKAYRGLGNITLPAPKLVVKPMLWGYLLGRGCIHSVRRVIVAEPLFKAYCKSYGTGVTTGIFVHWIQGRGDIVLGDHVNFDGKSSITFASRFVDRPTLQVGDHTGISHGCSFSIGKKITIGSHCRIASGVHILDSSGHPTAPQARQAGAPPADDDVKPVTIGDNVWIGRRATVFPGVTIGEGSIVASGSIVMTDVAPYTVVAGNPARKIGSLPRPATATSATEAPTT
jgi:acetyltransferase-like isoleucine patch superfamily enzyme